LQFVVLPGGLGILLRGNNGTGHTDPFHKLPKGYYDSIKLHAVLVLIGEHANTGIDVGRHSIVFNDKGWTFLLEQPTFVEIKYIFVYPEHRRTGFFTQILSLLQRQKKEIVVCTQERIMLQALIARGFQLDGHSLDGKELAYSLPVEPAK
jgi:GNAT superfamily N-acetyltransferase|tara:strand:- start:387 stop:836 length:450 start_codon:yes stop_codon:yes gene_type:complete